MFNLRITSIIHESIVDGPGLRYVVFTQGCKHNCKGCHNPDTHSFDKGYFLNIENIITDMKRNPLLDGLTLSGGEPFEQALVSGELARVAKDVGYNIISYTGYEYEYLLTNSNNNNSYINLLKNTDILIDGKFDINKRSLSLKFRGSTNQRVIDVQKSIKNGRVIEYIF